MGQNSCQPEGLQPESALAALLVLEIERLLPSPGALPSPILAATHTCFMVLGTQTFELRAQLGDGGFELYEALALLVDDCRRRALDEIDVGELALGFRDLAGEPVHLLTEARAFSGDIDF